MAPVITGQNIKVFTRGPNKGPVRGPRGSKGVQGVPDSNYAFELNFGGSQVGIRGAVSPEFPVGTTWFL